jgi:hypothetical protein
VLKADFERSLLIFCDCQANNWNYCESAVAITGGYDNGASMSMMIYARALPPLSLGAEAGEASGPLLVSGTDVQLYGKGVRPPIRQAVLGFALRGS